MRAKTGFFTALLMGAFLIYGTACKKKAEETPVTCKLVSVQRMGLDTAFITYDTQNRVTDYGSMAHGLIQFTYTPLACESTVQSAYNPVPTPYCHISLDDGGRVTYMTRSSTTSMGSVINTTYAFQYDSSQHIICCQQLRQEAGVTDEYYKDSLVYANGNLIAKYSYRHTGIGPYLLDGHMEISYTDEPNKIGEYVFSYYEVPITLGSSWNSIYHLFGKCSAHLPLVSRYYDSDGTFMFQVAYSFTVNENGYPEQEYLSTNGTSTFTEQRVFNYSCQ